MPKSVFSDAYASMLQTVIALRKGRGVSQVELARRIGREQPFVSRVERGERRIDVVEFCTIVRAIGEDPVAVVAELVSRLPDGMTI